MQEKISTIIATYNGEAFLKTQIDSILSQLPGDSEIIISDDGSTDRTIEIIHQYDDARFKLFINNDTRGAINNFENALKHVTGDIIFLSDQDDIWKPDKVKVCLEYLRQYDIVVSDCDIIDENDNIVLQSYFARRKSRNGLVKNLWANTYLGCCIAFNKKVLNISMPFPKDIPMHDIWLGFVGELFFKTCFINKPLVSYRMHRQNLSPTTVGISPHSIFSKFTFRWNTFKYFPLLFYRKWIK